MTGNWNAAWDATQHLLLPAIALVAAVVAEILPVLAAKQLGAERIIMMSRHTPRQKLAREFGAGGYVGRASGRSFDTRRNLAYPPYDSLKFDVPLFQEGDVNARVLVRLLSGRGADLFHFFFRRIFDNTQGDESFQFEYFLIGIKFFI